MADPILDEIWRVRAELHKKHGGIDGYFKYVKKIERAHEKRIKRKAKKAGRKRVSASR